MTQITKGPGHPRASVVLRGGNIRTGVGMVDLKDAVSLLRAKRQELIDQLDAVDKALSALSGLPGTVTMAPEANHPEASERTSKACNF